MDDEQGNQPSAAARWRRRWRHRRWRASPACGRGRRRTPPPRPARRGATRRPRRVPARHLRRRPQRRPPRQRLPPDRAAARLRLRQAPAASPAAASSASGRSSPTTARSKSRPGVSYEAWTYNGRVPGPTLRAHEGELLRVRFVNASEHPHTMHFHGIHTALMDGMPGIGEQPRRRSGRTGRELHLRVRRLALRAPPLPLPRRPAGRPHLPRPLRRLRRSTPRRAARKRTSW